MIRGLLTAVIILLVTSCVVRNFVSGPRLTGTCQGACAHYIECKSGHSDADRSRCEVECPNVFSDRDSLMAYENLDCQNAVEYVDGTQQRSANTSQ